LSAFGLESGARSRKAREMPMKRTPLLALLLVLCSIAAPAWSADKVWQKGTWREVKVERPKVVFGMTPNMPGTGAPRSAAAPMEKRSYVIETDTLRLELRQDAAADTPRVDALVGEPVTFAIEKNDIWIKDSEGHEHRMRISKRSPKVKSEK
jgi:hypothetical protein